MIWLFEAYREAYSNLEVYGTTEPDERMAALQTDNERLRQRVKKVEDDMAKFLLLHGV